MDGYFTNKMSAASLKSLIFLSFFYISWLFPGDKYGSFPIEAVYFILLLGICGVLAVYLIILQPLYISRVLVFFVMLLLTVALTGFWSPDKGIAVKHIFIWVFPLCIYLIYQKSSNDAALQSLYFSERLSFYMSIATLCNFVIGCAIGLVHYDIEQGLTDSTPGMLYSVSIDLVSFGLFFSIAYLSTNAIKKNLFYFTTLVYFLLLLLNFSKTYMAATFGAIIIGFVLSGRSLRTKVVLSLILIGVTFSIITTDNPFRRQLLWSDNLTEEVDFTDLNSASSALNTSGRVAIWTYLINESGDSPLSYWIGNGIGATEFYLMKSGFGHIGMTPHSDYVRLYVDFGIIGVAIYIFLLMGGIIYFASMAIKGKNWQIKFYSRLIVMLLLYMLIGGVGYELLNRHRTLLFILSALIATTMKLTVVKNSSSYRARSVLV